MGIPGDDQNVFLYTSIVKGSGFAVATAVTATVHDPSGGTSMVTLKDDGVCTYHNRYLVEITAELTSESYFSA